MRPFDRSTIRWFVVGAVLLAVGAPFLIVQGQDAAPDWRVGAVEELADAGLETGFPDGSFLAGDPLTGYQAAVLIDRLLDQVAARTGCTAPASATVGFEDVPGDHWATDAVAQLAALGVGDAFPEGRFDGNATLTGYQTALLVARALSSADAQVACSEQSGAAAVAAWQTEVGELHAVIGALQAAIGELQSEVGLLQTEIGDVRAAIAGGSLQGAAGPEGPPGPVGPAGADGVAGLPGEVGPRGADGSIGPAGPAGPVGAIGPVGPVGPAGADGQSGSDGSACWDRDGDGLPGLEEDVNLDGVWDARDCVGPVGPMGPEGPQGPVGDHGEVGPVGPQGEPGTPGAAGPRGPQGEVGPQGEIGPVGPEGPQGEPGPPGPPGRGDDDDDDDDDDD